MLDAFPAEQPVFRLDASHRSPGDGTTEETLPTEADNSGLFKIGYSSFNEMIIYGEIQDDALVLAPEGVDGSGTWNYDSAEIVFGHYDVRDAEGSSILQGSGHEDMQRGDEPDYGLRITAIGDAAGGILRTSTWVGWSIDTDFETQTAFEVTATGWRFLTIIPLDGIQNADEGDVFLPVPGSEEIQYIPFIISLNDADDITRETQQVWSIQPNVTGQWWNTPAQWETVAMAGIDATRVSAEDDVEAQTLCARHRLAEPGHGPCLGVVHARRLRAGHGGAVQRARPESPDRR